MRAVIRAAAVLVVTVLVIFGGSTVVAGGLSYPELSARISTIDPATPEHLWDILGVASGIEAATGLSDGEEQTLRGDLTEKFNAWTRARADELDPVAPGLKPFFDIQVVQRTSDYEEYTDAATKQYKEQQLTDKFNQWVRNRVDEIDPAEPNSLKAFFDLQLIQATDKYAELATPATDQYKHEQMGEKFNEWVRNRVDEIDPSEPGALQDFYDLQLIQATDKYEEFATPATHEYKEQQMAEKFNDWVRGLVDALDPNDPDFLEKLENLRIIQVTDKYDLFATPDTHQYKEQQLRDKYGTFIRNLVDRLTPGLPGFMEDLFELRLFQDTDLYAQFCLPVDRQYKEQEVAAKLQGLPGVPPQVVGAWPESGSIGVSPIEPLVIAFDQPMIPATIPPAIQITPPLPFTAEGMDNGHVWTVRPDPAWEPGAGYAVLITPVATSIDGNTLMAPVEILFSTEPPGPPPNIVSTMPVEGDPQASGAGVIEIAFDQPMWTETVETAVWLAPSFEYEASWHAGNTVLRMQPLAPLASDVLWIVGISDAARSETGVQLVDPFELHFFTGIHGTAAVAGTIPVDGQSGVPAGQPIVITFNPPMDAASVEGALSIDPPFDFIPLWFEANFVLQIEPVDPLEPATTVTIMIGDSATTIFGSPLEGGYIFSFTTDDPVYPRPLRLEIGETEPVVEILADPGDLHEVLGSYAPGEVLPVVLFGAPEASQLQPMIDDYLDGVPVPVIESTEYDPAARAARFYDPAATGQGRVFYRGILPR